MRGPTGPGGRFWLAVAVLWGTATGWDRLWLLHDGRLPSWDQADYLNSAVDHGRALGLLGGAWDGWATLLDRSPKIPPLASLVNGSVMALAGDSPDQASWSLAIWHALLLVVVAAWGRQLGGRRFGLLCAALVALAPALMALRVDYTLDIPLTAATSLALWLLGRWQAPAPRGGRAGQALLAALAISAALLVKQSALLLVALPALAAAGRGLMQRDRRRQVLLALALVLALVLPWLHHNWITALGGTNRAVVESAAAEGDPAVFSAASLLWYVRLLPQQLGWPLLLPGLAGLALTAAARVDRARQRGRLSLALPPGWGWLLGCSLAGWLATTLSPNKDARYIAPVLPLLLMLLAAGWWQLGLRLVQRLGTVAGAALLGAGLLGAAGGSAASAMASVQPQEPNPLPPLMARLRREVGPRPTTLLVVPGSPSLNEQNVTTYGRMGGGRIEGRRLGRRRSEHGPVLERANWLLLATGDQGTNRPFSRELSLRVRSDARFERVGQWPWSEGRQVELWRRRGAAAPGFDPEFIQLARGLEQGPTGLTALFDRIGPEHQLDGHFLYQQRVEDWARQRLRKDPGDRDGLWSLALLAVLQNRPSQADHWFAALERLEGKGGWPTAYRAVVLLAGWRSCATARVADTAAGSAPTAAGPVLRALRDLGRTLCLDPRGPGGLGSSLPPAIEAVKRELERP